MKQGIVFPVEMGQDCSNTITVRDSAGDILFEYTAPDDVVYEEDIKRMQWITDTLNKAEIGE